MELAGFPGLLGEELQLLANLLELAFGQVSATPRAPAARFFLGLGSFLRLAASAATVLLVLALTFATFALLILASPAVATAFFFVLAPTATTTSRRLRTLAEALFGRLCYQPFELL